MTPESTLSGTAIALLFLGQMFLIAILMELLVCFQTVGASQNGKR